MDENRRGRPRSDVAAGECPDVGVRYVTTIARTAGKLRGLVRSSGGICRHALGVFVLFDAEPQQMTECVRVRPRVGRVPVPTIASTSPGLCAI